MTVHPGTRQAAGRTVPTEAQDNSPSPRPTSPASIPAQLVPPLKPRRVDAGGTRLRLRALHVMGHGSARLARAIGVSEQAIQRTVRGDAKTVTPALRDAVSALYERWWDKSAPERTKAERAAANTARRRAHRGNWCAGAALDDDQLDRSGYQPRHGWRPAAGTGVAGSQAGPAREDIA